MQSLCATESSTQTAFLKAIYFVYCLLSFNVHVLNSLFIGLLGFVASFTVCLCDSFSVCVCTAKNYANNSILYTVCVCAGEKLF